MKKTRSSAGRLVSTAAMVSTVWGCSAQGDEWETEPLGTLEAANTCGSEENFEDVERYDGDFGVPEALVDGAQAPVGQPQGDQSVGKCSGALIARDLFLSAGHCDLAVGHEVWFNHQLDEFAVPRTPVIHTVTEVIQSRYDVTNADPTRLADFAVVRLSGTPGNTLGYLKLANEEARTIAPFSGLLTTIGHPAFFGGDDNFKLVSTGPFAAASTPLQPNFFGAQLDTKDGSSGGPIIRQDGQLIGVMSTEGCGPDTGNNHMRIPVALEKSQILQQVAAMQGVSFANLDGANGVDAVVVNFNRVAARTSNGSQFANQANWTSNAYFGEYGTSFADVTGDGRADAIVVNNNGITVRRSNGSSFNSNELWANFNFRGALGTFFADVTGDGRADAIALNATSVLVREANSTGTAFANPVRWGGTVVGSLSTFFRDVTGDGRADLVAVNDNLVTVRRSSGLTFGASENWTSSRFFGAFGTFVADVTGDGRADLIAVNNGVTTVRPSTGSAFGASANWLLTSHFGSLGTTFADATGDGRADSIAVTPQGITVRHSTGSAFGGSQTWVNVPYFGAR